MNEKIIAVMGATGAGKSSFIKLATQNDNVRIGHGMTSETQEITKYPLTFTGDDIVLVDTPGFDDTDRPDEEILQTLVDWLTETYKVGMKLSGIIYIHKISDVRIQGSAIRNLRVFRALCGNDCFQSVALCTSFWDTESENEETFESRLAELTNEEGWWGGMVTKGSKVFKGSWTRASALHIITALLSRPEITLQVQREIVDEHKTLEQTSTFSTLLEIHDREHQERMEKMQLELKEHQARYQRAQSENLEWMRKELEKSRVLEEERKRLQEELDAAKAKLNRTSISETNQTKINQDQFSGERPQANSSGEQTPEARPSNQGETLEGLSHMHRATTSAGDHISLFNEAVAMRHHRYISFSQAVEATVRLLEHGKAIGTVRCNYYPRKSCYNMVCVNCLRNIGGGKCYKCLECSQAHAGFVICQSCFQNPSVHCNIRSHDKQMMVEGRPNTVGTHCPRVLNPPQAALLFCSKCKQNVGKCYLHCCSCDERFDMCIKCATERKHCHGHGRSFPRQAHKLEICSRFIE